jgi:hypothetical protein
VKAEDKIDVIYILSEKSSGSSFLFRSLKDALNIKSYPKTIHFESETLYWTKAASLLDKPQLNMLASAVPYSKDRARKEIKEFLVSNLSHDIKFDSDEDMVFRGWFELVRKFGPVFIEKSPHHLLQWSALQLMLEFETRYQSKINCHYICLIRNPKDVFLSQFRRWNVDLELLENQWLVTYMNWKEFSSHNNSLYNKVALRYEDFVANPLIKVKEICKKFGLAAQYKSMEKAKKSKSASKSEKFGYKLSDSILNLSKEYGYTENSLSCNSSLSWTLYVNYIKLVYSPLKKIYNKIK